eukprot:1155354-Pelagomonas_calceolata.AAC.4
MEFWWSKLGFTPRLIRHVRRNRLPDEANFQFYQLWRTYAGSMQKTGNFRPQLTPSVRIGTSVLLKNLHRSGCQGKKECNVQ